MSSQPTPRTPPRPTARARKHPQPPISPSKRLEDVKWDLPNGWNDAEKVQRAMKEKLGLSYLPDLWQAHAVQRLLRGFDAMVVAATGLGKSLIFEGTAALAGPRKLVIVVCLLKALEVDQVQQACAKGLDALAINEDTDKTTSTWEHIRTRANLVYMSPEMSRSASSRQREAWGLFRT